MTPLQAYAIISRDRRVGKTERVLFCHIVRQGRIGSVARLAADCQTSQQQTRRRLVTLTNLGYLPAMRAGAVTA